ncbi:MAG: hypothetical protein IJ297_01905, partial [Clostridia bacterium]|nr:hypothetical protein [Clostridia bacterium]
MKRLIAVLLVLCMSMPLFSVAQTEEKSKIYIFGDDWAHEWGKSLMLFARDEADIINAATVGDLLSGITKKPEYEKIKKSDIVILSYGILERDRQGDKNAEFKTLLEKTVTDIEKKGAKVIFASICSTMRFNSLTGQMPETKNFYTETTRSYAAKRGIDYVDLALLTANWATKLGSG